MRKQITLEEFAEEGYQTRMGQWASDALSRAMDTTDQVCNYFPCHTVVKVEYEEGEDYKFESASTKVNHDYLDLYVDYSDQYKKYRVWVTNIDRLPHIDGYVVKDVKSTLTEPNQIGVINKKKIGDWIKYNEDLYNGVKLINDANGLLKDDFIESLEGLDVKWSSNSASGSIVKGGIEFSFTIFATHITKNLEIHYNVPNSLQSFKMLSDNNYKTK
jgi:hypothetical protein